VGSPTKDRKPKVASGLKNQKTGEGGASGRRGTTMRGQGTSGAGDEPIPARTKDVPQAGGKVQTMTAGEKRTDLSALVLRQAQHEGGQRSTRSEDVASRGGVNEENRRHNKPAG
jgi:hypothetical protein